jgi:UDP:flavonoid glycosyltransferase YjiC (YdhE family)
MLERVRPDAIVFDGTWPFQGLLDAVHAYSQEYPRPKLVWSNLTLYKRGTIEVPVSEALFDLVVLIGELGSERRVDREGPPGRKVIVPPVTLLRDEELLSREAARDELGLKQDGRYALFSLGPGNLKDVSGIGRGLIDEMRRHGVTVVWAQAPITVRDVPVPDDVLPIRVYPLVRVMRAFDYFAGAAGYNTCSEVMQTRVPTLFVPNTQVIDDQIARAELIARHLPAVVSACETAAQRTQAVTRLLELAGRADGAAAPAPAIELQGAEYAAEEIFALLDRDSEAHGQPAVQVGAAR